MDIEMNMKKCACKINLEISSKKSMENFSIQTNTKKMPWKSALKTALKSVILIKMPWLISQTNKHPKRWRARREANYFHAILDCQITMQPHYYAGTWFSAIVGLHRSRRILRVTRRSPFLPPKIVSVVHSGIVGEGESGVGAGRALRTVKDRLCPSDGDAVICGRGSNSKWTRQDYTVYHPLVVDILCFVIQGCTKRTFPGCVRMGG